MYYGAKLINQTDLGYLASYHGSYFKYEVVSPTPGTNHLYVGKGSPAMCVEASCSIGAGFHRAGNGSSTYIIILYDYFPAPALKPCIV